MRKFFLGCLALAFSGLVACSDLPTAPGSPEAEAKLSTGLMGCPRGPGGENCYTLPPVSGGPTIPACDAWMDANWCKGDQCIMGVPAVNGPEFSGIASCPIGGGPIGGPDGPGTGGPGTGGPTEPKPPLPEVPGDTCNTQHPVIDDPAVQAGFQDLWAKSGSSKAQTQRLEHAAWIVQNPDGSHRIEPFAYFVQTPCSVNGNMNAPTGAVGWVHTHPFTAGEEMRACSPVQREVSPGNWVVVRGPDGQPLYQRYANQPSQPDREFMLAVNGVRAAVGQNKLTGYMIDNDRIVVYGTNEKKDWPHARCGY
jgi:hypothetical protein